VTDEDPLAAGDVELVALPVGVLVARRDASV